MKKLKGFTKCPNCADEELTVPLSEDNNELVYALCDSSY